MPNRFRDLFRKLTRARSKTPSMAHAKESAEIIHSLAISPGSTSPASKKYSKARTAKLGSELAKPQVTKDVIYNLRNMNPPTSTSARSPFASCYPTNKNRGPVRAVCLDKIDSEAERDFTQLKPSQPAGFFDLEKLHVVDLVTNNYGFGQPVSSTGIFAGAIPTAETILTGIKHITPELMSLGYLTGAFLLPDHAGVYPPTTRMSVLTYWWGFELALPPPTIKHLRSAKSVSETAINFLTAIAAFNNGIKEILPFIRYISSFLELELQTIVGQDEGEGVVCAATWVAPIALVPRPWDFYPPPPTPNSIPNGSSGSSEQLPPSPSRTQTPPPSEAEESVNYRQSTRISVGSKRSRPSSSGSWTRPPSSVRTRIFKTSSVPTSSICA